MCLNPAHAITVQKQDATGAPTDFPATLRCHGWNTSIVTTLLLQKSIAITLATSTILPVRPVHDILPAGNWQTSTATMPSERRTVLTALWWERVST